MDPKPSGENAATASTPAPSPSRDPGSRDMDVVEVVDEPLHINPGHIQDAKDSPAVADAQPGSPASLTGAAGASGAPPMLPIRSPKVVGRPPCTLEDLPNELLFHIFEHLDVYDLLSTSRTSHLLRSVSLTPLLHVFRLNRIRATLPPLLDSRPPLRDLIARSIFLTHTSVVSRRLARSLVCISLSRRLAQRPSAEALVQRAVLPKECVPGMTPVHVSPALVQRKRAVERERIKDGLRRWIEGKWQGEVKQREEKLRRRDESRGVGRVWRLKRFWERVGRGEELVAR